VADQEPLDRATLEDLYERAPCGYVSTRPDGTILRVNQTFRDWTGFGDEDLVGRSFPELLAAGGRIFYETNYVPLLHLQGEVRDMAFDLRRADREPLPVLVSSVVVEEVGGEPRVIRSTIFDGTARHDHERQLHAARRRAEESERRAREVALLLQRSLLHGGLEGGPGFAIQTRYRPAAEDLEVGGDWYDAFLVPDREVVNVSVGDVVGRGIGAACAMGQLRSALRAVAGVGHGPGDTLDQLEAFAERIPDAHAATVVCAEIDPQRKRARYACAGHLPPLLVAPDGTGTYLWEGRSTPLATIPLAGPRAVGEVDLPPGGALLLYTDGLIERRRRDLDRGMEALAAAVADLVGAPPPDVADELLTVMLRDEEVRDDVCLLWFALDPTGS